MEKFNQQITVNLEVDMIAEMLNNALKPGKELVSKAIISSALAANDDNNTITNLFESLLGFEKTVPFKLGETVNVKEYFSTYEKSEDSEELKSVRKKMEAVKISSINAYSARPIQVTYMYTSYSGVEKLETLWVSLNKCEKCL